MDEFNNDELFENDNSAVPLEETDNTEKVESSSISEIFSFGEKKEDSFEDVDSSSSRDDSSGEAFQFEENGSYHFTPTHEKNDGASEEPHTANNGYAQQNPYRNPYHSGSYSSGGSTYSTADQSSKTTDYGYQEPKKPPRKKSAGKKILAVLLGICIICASVGIGISIGKSNTRQNPASSEPVSTTGDSATMEIQPSENITEADTDSVSPGIAVAKKSRSSVVGVAVYDAGGDLSGEGSGVVMGLNDSKDATYVITCAHVISDSAIKSCGVMLEDGKIEPATIVGFDERTDIGVIKVSKTNLQSAVFGDSTSLQVGEAVYAIGNPGGREFYGSMTSGIVSALDRSISSTYTMTVIQHNAAISPGNSGGALVNSKGQVIGINSSKISATDYEGIGFAIPVSVARPVVESLIKYGYVPNRPKLGISYASVSNYWRYSAIVQSKGLPAGSVIIAEISDDSSFKGTEVAVGDMITSVNGKKLTKSDILLDVIEKSKVGDEIKLGICRIERSGSVGGSYKINQFDVTVKLVEDKGSSATPDKEEETTQSFYDYYYGNGKGDENFGNFEDFFSQWFGN